MSVLGLNAFANFCCLSVNLEKKEKQRSHCSVQQQVCLVRIVNINISAVQM